MKKKIIIGIILSILGLMLISFFIKLDTNIYIGNSSGDYKGSGIDIQIKLDDKLLLNDSLFNDPYNYKIIKENLRCGIHKVNVISKRANINQEEKIFLFPNQFIIIEFYPREEDVPTFRIESCFNPFYYE